ncbi:MAG: methyltransferase domain-containing protein [Candidatus Heimdallarchaeota archaeon]|nr:methyltransferase domain-containing protein [Candidatus Heimdallarchaeota archaeon]
MIKKIDGLNLKIPKEVYDPAEDSFLLTENIQINLNNKVLEIGSGSGYVSIYLAKKFPQAEYFCVDINYYAANITNRNAISNNVNISTICSDLYNSFNTPTTHQSIFDVIIFNSPYLPVSEIGILEKAWSGGANGLEIVKNFIENLPKFLKEDGRSYLVVSSKTNTQLLEGILRNYKLDFEIKDSIREGNEKILLYLLSID